MNKTSYLMKLNALANVKEYELHILEVHNRDHLMAYGERDVWDKVMLVTCELDDAGYEDMPKTKVIKKVKKELDKEFPNGTFAEAVVKVLKRIDGLD